MIAEEGGEERRLIDLHGFAAGKNALSWLRDLEVLIDFTSGPQGQN